MPPDPARIAEARPWFVRAEHDLRAAGVLIPTSHSKVWIRRKTVAARMSSTLDLRGPDRAEAALMNRVLWLAIKGSERPCPQRHPAGGSAPPRGDDAGTDMFAEACAR